MSNSRELSKLGSYVDIIDDGLVFDAATTTIEGIDITELQAAVDLNTAKITNVTTDLTFTQTSATLTVLSSDGTDVILPSATVTLAGMMSAADKIKFDGIETGATADQTGVEIKSLYEANANTNALTDALLTKLNGIEALAEVTSTAKVAAAGAVMESDATTALMSFVIDEDDMVSNLATKVPTQQSVKAYVDGRVVSSVDYIGAYNASTNVPNLDSTPTGVKKGDMYTVTAAGQFFTETVEPGDVLIAEIDNATTLADWTVVQKNLDAGSVKVFYESNADTNAFTDTLLTKLNALDEVKLAAIEAGANLYIHPTVTDSNFANLTGPNVLSDVTVNTTGHITGFTSRAMTYSDIGAGTVLSVGGTGSVNGITLTGTVTSSGSLAIGGTLGGIANTQLVNSSTTIGTTAIALGASSTTLTGLTSVSSTSFTGTLSGNASSATIASTVAANSVTLGTDTTGNYVATITGTAGEIEVTGSGSENASVTIGLPNNVTIAGNLTVNGVTTTINSSTVTVDDPVFTLGGDVAPVADDGKDRGIEFRYFDTAARVGFFGYDDSTNRFTAKGLATNTSEVFSGTCLLYTSPSPRDRQKSRMPSSA